MFERLFIFNNTLCNSVALCLCVEPVSLFSQLPDVQIFSTQRHKATEVHGWVNVRSSRIRCIRRAAIQNVLPRQT